MAYKSKSIEAHFYMYVNALNQFKNDLKCFPGPAVKIMLVTLAQDSHAFCEILKAFLYHPAVELRVLLSPVLHHYRQNLLQRGQHLQPPLLTQQHSTQANQGQLEKIHSDHKNVCKQQKRCWHTVYSQTAIMSVR